MNADRILDALEARGLSAIPHAVTDFRSHLLGTMRILAGWGEPDHVCLAGLLHSVYGTGAFDQPLFGLDERDVVRELVGADAERLIHLFCTARRTGLLPELRAAAAGETTTVAVTHRITGETFEVAATLVAEMVVIDIANIAEQSHEELRPAPWVAMCSMLASLVLGIRGKAIPLPPVVVDDDAEQRACELYESALAQWDQAREAERRLVEAALANPLVGEPRLLAACLAHRRGDSRLAAIRARAGLERLRGWCTAWDKRATWDEWVEFGEALLRFDARAVPPIEVSP